MSSFAMNAIGLRVAGAVTTSNRFASRSRSASVRGITGTALSSRCGIGGAVAVIASPFNKSEGVSMRGTHVCAAGGMTDMIMEKNEVNPVIVYSKTYCPFCMEVKSLFNKLGVDAAVVELDNLADGADVQDALTEVSGQRTVPQVFIGGKFLGGCDDTMSANRSGKLQEMLKAAGV